MLTISMFPIYLRFLNTQAPLDREEFCVIMTSQLVRRSDNGSSNLTIIGRRLSTASQGFITDAMIFYCNNREDNNVVHS